MAWPENYAAALADEPTQTAQDKFGRIADAFASGLRNMIETPGRAMREGITTDQAVDWAAPMAMGMVGAPAAPAGAVGSGLTRALRTGDNAAIDAMRVAARERAEQGGSTVRVYDTQRQLDASRGLTEADQGAEKAKAGWQAARNSALDDFRAAVAGEREPPAVPREYEPDPFGSSLQWPPSTDAYPPRDLSAKQQMSLADLLSTFGSGSNSLKGSAANAAVIAGSPQQGIRAYHGSPYDFDRFDLNKIGTGEGAQAYGHGLYFAENKATAADYKKKLSGPFSKAVDNELIRSASGELPLTAEHMGTLRHFAADENLSALDAAKRLQWRFPELRDPGMQGQGGDFHRGLAAAIEQTRNAGKGRMYEVNIGAKPEQFLDWDKPLSQQPSNVQGAIPADAISRAEASLREGYPVDGSAAYKFMAANANSADAATRALREAGIPGIRYLDQGSRRVGAGAKTDDLLAGIMDATGGNRARAIAEIEGRIASAREMAPKYQSAEGIQGLESARDLLQSGKWSDPRTSNYVVFDPGIVDILRKYGLAGLTAGGATNYAAGLRDQQ